MRIAALILVIGSRTVAAQSIELTPPASAWGLEESQREDVERKVRRLQRRSRGLLIGAFAPLAAGIGLSIRGARLAPEDGELEMTGPGSYEPVDFSPVRNILGGVGIAAGIFMLGRARRVARHAHELAHPPSLASQRARYERRGRRLSGIGGAFLIVGVGSLIGALISVASYDCDDDFICIPPGLLLAIPAAAFTAIGAVLVIRGVSNRKRSRATRAIELGVGLASARFQLRF